MQRQAFKRGEDLVESRIFIGTRTLVVKFNHLSGMMIKIILIKCFSRDTTPIADLHYLGNIYRSPADKAKVFNSYFTFKLKQGLLIASSPGHSQILSCSRGEKSGCEIKSGSGLGTRLATPLD